MMIEWIPRKGSDPCSLKTANPHVFAIFVCLPFLPSLPPCQCNFHQPQNPHVASTSQRFALRGVKAAPSGVSWGPIMGGFPKHPSTIHSSKPRDCLAFGSTRRDLEPHVPLRVRTRIRSFSAQNPTRAGTTRARHPLRAVTSEVGGSSTPRPA